MHTSKDTKFFIQTLADDVPSLSEDVAENFESLVAANLKWLKEDFPSSNLANPKNHYIAFAFKDEFAVAYTYFWIENEDVQLFAAFTTKNHRREGLAASLYNLIFSSEVLLPYKRVVATFDNVPSEERTGLFESLKKWFQKNGPKDKELELRYRGKKEVIKRLLLN